MRGNEKNNTETTAMQHKHGRKESKSNTLVGNLT